MRISLVATVLFGLLMTHSMAAADNIVAVATGDWNLDGAADAAVILAPGDGEDDNSLKIYLAESSQGRLRLQLHKSNFVWGHEALAGAVPGIKALANGSIAVTSRNEATGRNRWNQQITIAYREGEFVIAGFTYSARDTLELEKTDECDLNLRAGIGDLNGKRVKFQAVQKSVVEWDDRIAHDICEQKKPGR